MARLCARPTPGRPTRKVGGTLESAGASSRSEPRVEDKRMGLRHRRYLYRSRPRRASRARAGRAAMPPPRITAEGHCRACVLAGRGTSCSRHELWRGRRRWQLRTPDASAYRLEERLGTAGWAMTDGGRYIADDGVSALFGLAGDELRATRGNAALRSDPQALHLCHTAPWSGGSTWRAGVLPQCCRASVARYREPGFDASCRARGYTTAGWNDERVARSRAWTPGWNIRPAGQTRISG